MIMFKIYVITNYANMGLMGFLIMLYILLLKIRIIEQNHKILILFFLKKKILLYITNSIIG